MNCQRQPSATAAEGSIDSDSTVTARIVSTVAEQKGVEPAALDERLYDAVDPDALSSLVNATPEARLTISFDYAGYRVTVVSDGDVAVDATPLA
jgi:hypothetical protein